eukprot:8465435-Alexandrium_andersonii.AAC.1
MSASLVGSEMCIRDRRSIWQAAAIPPWLTLKRCPIPRGRGCGPSRRAGPVSYTHLTLPTICSV